MASGHSNQSEGSSGGGGVQKRYSSMISGVTVNFPVAPYPSQMAMMSKVIQGLKGKKNCLLESPTGSGKSLALLCSAIAWQQHEAARVERYNAEIDAREAAEADRIRKMQAAFDAEEKEKQQQCDNNEKPGLGSQNTLAVESTSTDGVVPVYELTDDDSDDDFKPLKRTRISASTSFDANKSNYTSDSSFELEDTKGKKPPKQTENQPPENNANFFEPPDKRLTVPKIFFGSRTHKQIEQITRELRKTGYSSVRSVVLASRDHTCINPAVERKPNKNELCRELVQNSMTTGNGCMWYSGARKLGSFGALASAGVSPGYDLEDLVTAGRMHKACPYYGTRFLMQSADIIFCPYNYMIDPSIRKSMNLDLNGHVLIFDEAHNMEDAAREAASLSIKQVDLMSSLQDCEKVANSGNEKYAHDEIAKFLSSLSEIMDRSASGLQERSYTSSGRSWNGTDFLGLVHASGLTEKNIKMQMAYFQAIATQREQQIEAMRERGARLFNEKPTITNQTFGLVENVFRLFNELTRDNGRYRNDFRVALTKEFTTQRREGNSGSFKSVQILSLNLWCLNPAVAFEDIRGAAHAIVLTSGTLSPMQSFESELGTPFSLKLEASHVIDKHQIRAAAIAAGPTGVNLNGTYQNTETLKYKDELGNVVLRICNIVPHGVLCFFPSYRLLENTVARWRDTGLYDRLEKNKVIVMEPRSGSDFQAVMDEFYEGVENYRPSQAEVQEDLEKKKRNPRSLMPRNEQTGSIFFAVYRGKVSEGMDFADENARAVICVGIPFPNFKNLQVELKRGYNTQNTSKGLLNGGDWYEIQAFRALNQALGRCIRHRHDWGSIFLVDDRYIRTPRYLTSLPKWMRLSVQTYNEWGNLDSDIIDHVNGNGIISKQFLDNEISSQNKPTQDRYDRQWSQVSSLEGNTGTFAPSNTEDDMNESSSYFGNQTTSADVPFQNSSSSAGNSGSTPYSGRPKNSSKSGLSSFAKENLGSPKFNNPPTPVSIFSKKSAQKANNSISSLFAKQRQRQEMAESSAQNKFSINNISLEQNPKEVIDIEDDSTDPSTTTSTGVKRPREKKMKL